MHPTMLSCVQAAAEKETQKPWFWEQVKEHRCVPKIASPRRRREKFLVRKRTNVVTSTLWGGVLSRHRCVPKIASPEARNPENILQRNTNVVTSTLWGGVRSRHRCVPKIASPENDKSKTYYSTTENSRGTVRATVRATGGRILDFVACNPLVFADASLRTHKDKLVGKSRG